MSFWKKKPTAREAAANAKKETKREVRVSDDGNFFLFVSVEVNKQFVP